MWKTDRATMGSKGDDAVLFVDEHRGSVSDDVLLFGDICLHWPGVVSIRHSCAWAGRLFSCCECRRETDNA